MSPSSGESINRHCQDLMSHVSHVSCLMSHALDTNNGPSEQIEACSTLTQNNTDIPNAQMLRLYSYRKYNYCSSRATPVPLFASANQRKTSESKRKQ